MKNDAGGMTVQKFFVSGFVVFLFSVQAYAGIGGWKSYTNMKSVRSVIASGTAVWAGTSGGLFGFTLSDSSYRKITNADGLSSNDITVTAVDTHGSIWVGEANGSIDLFSPAANSWKYISDITSTDNTDKRILSITPESDTVFIGTGFGLAIFSLSKFEFRETINNFGGVQQPAIYDVKKFQNRIFVVTSEGFFASKQNAVNLSAPDSWELLLNDKTGNSFAVARDTLFAASSQALYYFFNNTWNTLLSGAVEKITSDENILYYARNQIIFAFDAQHQSIQKSRAAGSSITALTINNASVCYAGFSENGIGSCADTASEWKYYFPNGPGGNQVTSLAVDNNGTVWAASGRTNGKGFYSFNGSTWRTYSVSNTPLLKSNDCFAVSIGPNNSKWISSWGTGLYVVNSAGTVVRRFDHLNPGFIGIANNLNYIVPARVAVDHDGNVWTSIYLASNQSKVVWKMSPDSTWHPYPSEPSSYNSMLQVVVDQYNTKWFGNRLYGFPASAKVVYFNERSTIGTAYNGWGNLQTSDGFTATGIYDIALENNGDIWFATDAGITIVTEPQNPQIKISRVYLGSVRDLQINCIAVDPLNNKWIGTNVGAFVVNADGTSQLNQYTVAGTNGKLVDDNILSIAFDNKKGIAYFGTEKGLSALNIPTVGTVPEMTTLQISPNPVFLPSASSVEIRGLADNCNIKVLSVTGKLIKQFPAQGAGRAFWDLKDSDGNTVGSGVYLFVAYTSDGGQVVSGKAAVIRK